MGLLIAQTPDLVASMNWVWVVTFAYTQLLLARTLVKAQPRPWDPKPRRALPSLTPGQLRQAWLAFSHGLGTPARPPRPSGRSPGRTPGFLPSLGRGFRSSPRSKNGHLSPLHRPYACRIVKLQAAQIRLSLFSAIKSSSKHFSILFMVWKVVLRKFRTEN
jgi:hypothetical protein